MSSEVELLQGALDLILLRALEAMDVWLDSSTLSCSTSRSNGDSSTIPASSRSFLPTASR
jgi:hypothetical protein